MKHQILNSSLKYGYFCSLLAVVLFYSQKYLLNPWLWFDESGQFWIAKGLNHYSDPYSLPQGVLAVIENNRYYNLDPGGFSVLLHYWTMISNNYIFIRFLPYMFYCLFVYYSGKIIYEYTHSSIFSVTAAFTIFLWDTFISRMVEVRAYSMEMFGVVLILYLLERYKEFTFLRLLLLSLILSFFCTSRYEFIVVAFLISIYVITNLFRRRALVADYLVYCIPLIITVGAIYWFMMRYQNASANPLSYLYYLSDFHPKNKLFLCYLLNCTLVAYSFYSKKRLNVLELFSFAIPTTIAILSLANRMPWDSIRSISIVTLIYLNITVFVYQHMNITEIFKVLTGFVCFMCLNSFYPFWLGTETEIFQDFCLLKTKEHDFEKTITFIDNRLNPSLRYLYEYGIFNDNKVSYPFCFILQKRSAFNKETIDNKGNHIHLLNPLPIDKDCNYYLLYSTENIQYDSFERYNGCHFIFTKKY